MAQPGNPSGKLAGESQNNSTSRAKSLEQLLDQYEAGSSRASLGSTSVSQSRRMGTQLRARQPQAVLGGSRQSVALQQLQQQILMLRRGQPLMLNQLQHPAAAGGGVGQRGKLMQMIQHLSGSGQMAASGLTDRAGGSDPAALMQMLQQRKPPGPVLSGARVPLDKPRNGPNLQGLLDVAGPGERGQAMRRCGVGGAIPPSSSNAVKAPGVSTFDGLKQRLDSTLGEP